MDDNGNYFPPEEHEGVFGPRVMKDEIYSRVGVWPFILSQQPWRPPKLKKGKPPDLIEPELDETWSEMRTEALGRPVFYFRVWNATKAHEYTCEAFEGVNGEPCAWCSCPAYTVCKHIIACVQTVLLVQNADFGTKFGNCEFFAGLRGNPASLLF